MLQVCAFLAFAVKLVASRFCGRESNENRIKQLTGGDPLTARFMRQDLFTFMTTHKLFIVGNNQPKLIKVDDAARRRFQMIPFLLKIAQPDKQLREKLLLQEVNWNQTKGAQVLPMHRNTLVRSLRVLGIDIRALRRPPRGVDFRRQKKLTS